MSYPTMSAAENVLVEIRLKTPKVQTLIGTGAGVIIAIGLSKFPVKWFLEKGKLLTLHILYISHTASIKIAESIALFVGAALLILSLATDVVYIPNINLKFDLNFINSLIRSNGPLANGFIAGYLIGFAMV